MTKVVTGGLIELRLKNPVNNISVMSGLLPEREGDKKKEEKDRLKRPQPDPNRPHMKQISSCQQSK